MKISEKIKEMQGDLDKYHVTEKNDEYLDFMFYKREGPTFSLSIKKEQICGLSILHKPEKEEEREGENLGMSKALYQWFYCIIFYCII